MLKTLRPRLPAMLFGLMFFALCGAFITPLSAGADTVTLDYAGSNIYKTVGSGINYQPVYNWMTATFTDIAANEVQLTVSTPGFSSGVFLGANGLYFNFNPSKSASSVAFAYQGSTGTGVGVNYTTLSTANAGSTSIQADGGGYYNFELKWGTTSAKELSGYETATWDLTATGLKASDFAYQSSGGTTGNFYAAAYLQETGNGAVWVDPGTPLVATPIPGTLLLFGPGLAWLAALRKRLSV